MMNKAMDKFISEELRKLTGLTKQKLLGSNFTEVDHEGTFIISFCRK